MTRWRRCSKRSPKTHIFTTSTCYRAELAVEVIYGHQAARYVGVLLNGAAERDDGGDDRNARGQLLRADAPTASQPQHGQNYNYPQRWYLKPDGTVVSLQGDPQNRAYYQDKGFRMLSDSLGRDGHSEVRQYLDVEYPKLLKQQRDKAALINAIRRAGEHYRDLNLEDTFDDYSVGGAQYLADIKRGPARHRVILPKRAKAREDA